MSGATVIALRNDRFELLVEPARGGSIVAFRHAGGGEIFRDALPGGTDAPSSSCFPMVPFCNRVRDRRFVWSGREIVLRANTDDGRQTAHGFGWRSPWFVIEQTDLTLAIRHEYPGADWPWAYRAEQRFVLNSDGLALSLRLTNMSETPMPAGLGFHPYFPLRPGCRVAFSADSCEAKDAAGFPALDDCGGHIVALANTGQLDPLIGNRYFSGVGGEIIIDARSNIPRTTLKTSPNLSDLALHVEEDPKRFCLEPMSHPVGPFDARHDGKTTMVTLAAASTMSISLSVRIE